MAEHPPLHAITGVIPIDHGVLLLQFDWRELRIWDARTLLGRSEPLLAPLSDEGFFRAVAVDRDGETICWPNGLDFDPAVLYQESVPVVLPWIGQSLVEKPTSSASTRRFRWNGPPVVVPTGSA